MNVYRNQQIASHRLMVLFTSLVHARLYPMREELKRRVKAAYAGDGTVDLAEQNEIGRWYRGEYEAFMVDYRRWLRNAMMEAAKIGLAQIGAEHNELMPTVIEERAKRVSPLRAFPPLIPPGGGEIREVSIRLQNVTIPDERPPNFDDLITRTSEDVVQAIGEIEYIRADGTSSGNLSDRIWQMDKKGVDEFERIMAATLTEGISAGDTALLIEGYLGVGQDCPRWAEEALYKNGGSNDSFLCASTGWAYNALRLARTEIASVMGRAKMIGWQRTPWVEASEIHLSPQHPKSDICDTVVASNPHPLGKPLKNSGGKLHTPIHPNCMCYMSAADMPSPEAFAERVRSWANGEPDDQLDSYQEMLGVSTPAAVLSPVVRSAVIKQFGQVLDIWLGGSPSAHLELLDV